MPLIDPRPDRHAERLLRIIEKRLGSVPPHFRFFAALNPERFRNFLDEIAYIAEHPRIDPDFFIFLRRIVAERHGYDYCRSFNETMLRQRGYTPDRIRNVLEDPGTLPLDEAHRRLMTTVLRTTETPESLDAKTLETLHRYGWSDADIFDAIDHGAFLFRYSVLLRAYRI